MDPIVMNPTVSLPPALLAKLRAAEGEGLSRDPKNSPRKTIKLLTDKDDELKPGAIGTERRPRWPVFDRR